MVKVTATKTEIMIATWADAPSFDFGKKRFWNWPVPWTISAERDQTPPGYVPSSVEFWREEGKMGALPAVRIMARYDGQTDCVEVAPIETE